MGGVFGTAVFLAWEEKRKMGIDGVMLWMGPRKTAHFASLCMVRDGRLGPSSASFGTESKTRLVPDGSSEQTKDEKKLGDTSVKRKASLLGKE